MCLTELAYIIGHIYSQSSWALLTMICIGVTAASLRLGVHNPQAATQRHCGIGLGLCWYWTIIATIAWSCGAARAEGCLQRGSRVRIVTRLGLIWTTDLAEAGEIAAAVYGNAGRRRPCCRITWILPLGKVFRSFFGQIHRYRWRGRLSRGEDDHKQENRMYFSCLLIRNIISFSVRPAESPGHNVGSVVSKHKRSSLNSALGFHLSPGGLG